MGEDVKKVEIVEKKSGFGIACFVLSIIGFLTGFIAIGLFFDVIAVVFGVIALIMKKQKNGLAIAGLVIAITGFLVMTLIVGALSCNSDKPTVKVDSAETATDNVQGEKEQADTVVDDTDSFNVETVVSQLEITEYSYTDTINTDWLYLEVKNKSEYDIDLTIHLNQYDADGNIIGAESQTMEALESQGEMLFTYMLDDMPSSTDYEFEVSECDFFEPILSDLAYEVLSTLEDKVIIEVTNNGSEIANSVDGKVLFFKDGVLVGSSLNFFVDNDGELKAGDSIKEEFECHQNFDDIKIYLSGYSY